MNGCNATLTTATTTPCPHAPGEVCSCTFARHKHVELHTLTCMFHDASFDHYTEDESAGGIAWTDDTPGATPHTPVSTVTDAEVEAAIRAIREAWRHEGRRNERMRAALEAFVAFRASQEKSGLPGDEWRYGTSRSTQETCPNPHCEDGVVSNGADWEAPCRQCSKQGD